MRIIVFPHTLEIGGSQLNAIELAAAVRDRGHDVTVVGQPGALQSYIEQLELPFRALPEPRRRPSSTGMSALCTVAAETRADLVHGYEWPPALEAFFGPQRRLQIPAVCTVMSMGIAPFIPSSMPLVVGTAQIADAARRRRHGPVTLLEPPVDTHANRPDFDARDFRARHGIESTDLLIVVVSRLASQLKLEGILAAINAVNQLARHRPVRLLIAGDGPAAAEVKAAAVAANKDHDRDVVILTGELLDPRPAYASADVVLGMGGSALRAMAFAKPLVVQGERGFWKLLTAESVDLFSWQGWYGIGDGSDGSHLLTQILVPLLDDPPQRAALGAFALALVSENFSLLRAAEKQEQMYRLALASPMTRRQFRTDSARTLAGLGDYKVRRRLQRWRRTVQTDDFNALSTQPTSVGVDRSNGRG